MVGIVLGGTLQVPMSDFCGDQQPASRAARSLMYSSPTARATKRVTISGNRSDTRVSARPLQLNNIDGLTLTGNTQPMNPAGSPFS